MTHSYSVHLRGDEQVRTDLATNHDALYIEGPSHTPSTGIVLSHWASTPADRIRILRELATAASDLADEINLRDLEAAS